ncbi:MAG: class I SAM-dependent methyltransferase [Deltaproteobacteria bacterium]|nr:class I SAM-dependent methyltransferase [Deltaproteobacteria bacterium]
MTFKDHFSGHAGAYAAARPRYPAELFAELAARVASHALAWDVGTGNGQAAVGLAAHFDRVWATDASAEQLARAEPHARVTYRVAPAEASGLADAQVDLVTVAQALHWFELDAFYAEVRRVLRPSGCLAAWCYARCQVEGALGAALDAFYDEVVGPYWPPERRHVEAGYRTLPFPFAEEETPELALSVRWRLQELLAYVETWSALQRYRAARGEDPLLALAATLAPLWGEAEQPRAIVFPIFVRLGRRG